MPALKGETFDPFGIDQAAATPAPIEVASTAAEPTEPAPAAEPKARTRSTRRPKEPEPAPADAELETLFVRVTPDVGEWLRELRFRNRLPAAALVRALVDLAREDDKLLARALQRARDDKLAVRPGPRSNSS